MTQPNEEARAAAENLALALANNPFTATPEEASAAYQSLTAMYSHRGDGIPTQYVHGSEVAKLAAVMWHALIASERSRIPPDSGTEAAFFGATFRDEQAANYGCAGEVECTFQMDGNCPCFNSALDRFRQAAIAAATPDLLARGELRGIERAAERERTLTTLFSRYAQHDADCLYLVGKQCGCTCDLVAAKNIAALKGTPNEIC